MSWWDNAPEDELKRWGLENENPFYTRKPVTSKESQLTKENQKLKEEVKSLKKKLGE